MTNKFKMKQLIKAIRTGSDDDAQKAEAELIAIAEQLDREVMEMGVDIGSILPA